MRAALLLLSLLLSPAAQAEDLADLLARGELALLETRPDGRVAQVTSIVDLDAPIAVVWAKITDFAAWKDWVPQVLESTATPQGADSLDVRWSIKAVGPPVRFTGRYTLDRARWTVRGRWLEGALEGSTWAWRLEDLGGRTRLYRTAFTNAVADNWLLRSFDDDAHTLEIGLNAATGLIEAAALKRALSGSASP